MGQYYFVVNLDKKQYLHAHKFGDGLKLLEQGSSGDGAMCGLAILLSDGNGRGGGDLHIREGHPLESLVGSWAGDRIVMAGDYADNGRWLNPNTKGWNKTNLYEVAGEKFENISDKVITVMCEDTWLRDALLERTKYYEPERLPECLKDWRVLRGIRPCSEKCGRCYLCGHPFGSRP